MKKVFLSLFLILSLVISPNSFANFCNRYDCSRIADLIIANDSRSWFLNRYDYGSAEVVDSWETKSQRKARVKVYYTYNNGSSGWAELYFDNGQFDCIRYWDFPDSCRRVRSY